MIRVKYRTIEDPEYNPALCWQNGTVFCERDWLAAVTTMGRGKVGLWSAFQDDELVAIAPVLWRRTTFGRMTFLPPLTPYWGLALKPGSDATITGHILNELVKHCVGWRISLPPDQSLPAVSFPTRRDVRTTQIILPKPKELLWHDLATSCRQKIRSAQNEELALFEGDPDELALLITETFIRKKVNFNLDRATLAKTLATMVDSGLCHIRGIRRKGGQSLSMRMVVQDKPRKISYDIAAGSAEGLRGGAGNLLLWEEIVGETSRGHALDLVGTGVSGVADFKRSFGGIEKGYIVMEMFRDKVSEMRYRLGRRLGMLK